MIMNAIPITAVEVAETKPNYSAGAMTLLARIREFYEDPENEAAYQRWKAEQEEQTKKEAGA